MNTCDTKRNSLYEDKMTYGGLRFMLKLKKIVNPYEWERSHLTGSYILPGATYYEDDEDGFIIRADEYAELKKRKKEEEFDYSRLIGAQNEREYSEMMRQMYREYNQDTLLDNRKVDKGVYGGYD